MEEIFHSAVQILGFLVLVAVTGYTWGAFTTMGKNDNKKDPNV